MFHANETWPGWPVRKENEVVPQSAEMRMVRRMCGIKRERERLGIDDMTVVLQLNRLQWYGHVFRKEDNDWMNECFEYEVEGPRPRGNPKRTWTKVVEKDCQACKLNKEVAVDCSRWRKLVKDV